MEVLDVFKINIPVIFLKKLCSILGSKSYLYVLFHKLKKCQISNSELD